MKKTRKNRPTLTWLLFIISSILVQEIILGIFIGGRSIWLLSFVLIIPTFIFALVLLVKREYRKWLMDIYLVSTALIFSTEFLYYRFFKAFYGIHMISGVGQLGQFFGDGVKLFILNLPVLIFFALPSFFYFAFLREGLEKLEFKSFVPLVMIYVSVLSFALTHLFLMILPYKPASAHELYFYESTQLETARKFGLVGSLNIELSHRLFGSRIPEIDQNILGLAQSELAPVEEERIASYEIRPQILDIDFDKLAKTRDSDLISGMDEYFSSVYPTMTNEYTGIFKGYNLIFLTAESLWGPAVDPVRTPTLYKMMTEGIHMKDFYNPLWTASTSDGEYVGLSGMIPKDGIWSLLRASGNYSPQLPGWRFKEAGYSCFAYHNHDYTYYDRHISHPQIGYDYKGVGSGLDMEDQWPQSDLKMMELSLDDFIDREPFHVYYLTVSGHSAYSFSGNAMANKNRELVEDLELSEEARSYLAANLELEHALKYLLERLNERGIAERTIIAINPDHYPYALSTGAIKELAGEPESIKDLYSSVGFIYVQGMKPLVVEKPVSSLDLLPSLYNLMAIDFDSRLLMGRDIFSSGSLIPFVDRSWLTEKGFYNASKDKFTATRPVVDDYEAMIHERLRASFYYSGLILEEDYYSYLPEEAFELE